ncbi:hypothetical protein [Mycobacteroides abscessus]|uniref:hypothetical protein n=1 Tax=Mycobacteroides abscessus TaxID=36809 RepID=UPI00092B9671|nr:hypothetical protein [Mycobacteroides abscessus]MDO3042098.1 hypothetical protein [Mycobacteroides abscessus subsp. abscessus]MDO3111531.1 hypothetical protein [Mycobacteroides abscessus subsp. massiliense]SIC66297.1 Uncharacterised protein [Mycobacteroides abscessus subsp. abscessus]SIC88183.1 Uncharacterised protein [Mycobacteroides abscessus subsp. abscessus]SID08627.1 Uncharacterised protein [Mycobacteroides abscessus subsp. abscessus]
MTQLEERIIGRALEDSIEAALSEVELSAPLSRPATRREYARHAAVRVRELLGDASGLQL